MADPLPVPTARQLVLDSVQPLAAEEVALGDALGRILAEAVTAAADVPPFASSAMDGFAVAPGASGRLAISGESRAGLPFPGLVEPGTAVRISTGAVVPEGTGAVVQVELAEESDGVVAVPAARAGHQHPRRRRGHRRGRRGAGPRRRARSRPSWACWPASAVRRCSCAARPRVALLTTGDELTPPGTPLPAGGIYSSNGPALAALVRDCGGVPVLCEDVPDTAEGTRAALARGLDSADVVCVSGGVSVGPHDHVKGAFAEQGVAERFWRVALKPGKPTWFGTTDRVLAFGLPGNPVSALVTFLLFVRPALLALQGANPEQPRIHGTLTAPVRPEPGRTQAVRCRLAAGDDGWELTPTGPQGSHQLTSMLGAGALAMVEAGSEELAAGTRVVAEILP